MYNELLPTKYGGQMLSIITSARNDNYGGEFVKRFRHALESNIDNLRRSGIQFEYIVAQWCPDTPFDEFILDYPEVIELVIDKSVSDAEQLNPNVFYEYFAKNAGIRHAKYPNLLIINADILLGYDLIYSIQKLCSLGLEEDKYYRPMYRHNYDLVKTEILHTQELWEPHNPDGHLAAGYSGDFLLVSKKTLLDKGKGYDETDPGHRSNFQTGMDGEILSNMYHNGVRPQMIDAGYYHLNHSKNRSYTGSNYRKNIKYDNKPNWGFVDYTKEKINEQLYRIKTWMY